ncbi:MAG: hypothetical protein ACR2PF_09105 [Rhizobiaceae bacterium]
MIGEIRINEVLSEKLAALPDGQREDLRAHVESYIERRVSGPKAALIRKLGAIAAMTLEAGRQSNSVALIRKMATGDRFRCVGCTGISA